MVGIITNPFECIAHNRQGDGDEKGFTFADMRCDPARQWNDTQGENGGQRPERTHEFSGIGVTAVKHVINHDIQ